MWARNSVVIGVVVSLFLMSLRFCKAEGLEEGAFLLDGFEEAPLCKGEVTIVNKHVTQGKTAGKITLGSDYVFLALDSSNLKTTDWTGYQALMVDLYNPCDVWLMLNFELGPQVFSAYLPPRSPQRTGVIFDAGINSRRIDSVRLAFPPVSATVTNEESATPKAPFVYIDNIRLVKKPEYKGGRGNLLLNGDFALGYDGSLPAGWSFIWTPLPVINGQVAVDSQMPGIDIEQSLKITVSDKERRPVVKSPEICVEAGSNYTVSFWLKGEAEKTTIWITVDGWVPSVPHWYVTGCFNATPQWKRQCFSFHVPGPGEDNYTPARKSVRLALRISDEAKTATVWFNDSRVTKRGY